MAVTYGSTNLGSSSNGGFAIYTATTTGAEAISVLVADFTTNVVSAAPNAVPLTALQSAALSTILAKLRAAAPTASTLAILRKLVGVVSLTDSVQLVLSVSSVGAVHTLRATTSAAGTALVYVPNAAAAGLFTGTGSDVASLSGGAAGGALQGTYPNPLIADGVIPYDFMLPVQLFAPPLAANFLFQSFAVGRDCQFGDNAEQQNFFSFGAATAQYIIGVFFTSPTLPLTLGATITFDAGSQIGTFAWQAGFDRAAVAGTTIAFIGQIVPDATFATLFGTLKSTINY